MSPLYPPMSSKSLQDCDPGDLVLTPWAGAWALAICGHTFKAGMWPDPMIKLVVLGAPTRTAPFWDDQDAGESVLCFAKGWRLVPDLSRALQSPPLRLVSGMLVSGGTGPAIFVDPVKEERGSGYLDLGTFNFAISSSCTYLTSAWSIGFEDAPPLLRFSTDPAATE